MKRVIDGRSYNTDTATKVARWDYQDDQDRDTEATLYRNRGGAFFAVHLWEVTDAYGAVVLKSYWEAMTHEEVGRMVLRTDGLEIIDEAGLEAPPEAVDESEPGATLYLRLPATLKARVDTAAAAAGLSANAYAMRCLETCLGSHKAA